MGFPKQRRQYQHVANFEILSIAEEAKFRVYQYFISTSNKLSNNELISLDACEFDAHPKIQLELDEEQTLLTFDLPAHHHAQLNDKNPNLVIIRKLYVTCQMRKKETQSI